MNWNLAIETNLEALKRILAMLVAMVEIAGGASADLGINHQKTLPRHLHRVVLRLLRPAESATRRLIIVAARGLVVKLPPLRPRKPSPKKPPLNRKNGYGTGLVIRPGPLPEWAKALVPKRSPSLSLPLLDPLKRFGVRRRYAKPNAMPQIRVLGGDPIVPLFRRPEPLPPPPPTPDDPLDASRIHQRLEAIGLGLDNLPKQAQRMARWQARRDARWAGERGDAEHPGQSLVEDALSPSRPSGSPLLPHEPEGLDGEGVNWDELGLTPEVLALCRRAKSVPAQSSITAQAAKPRRFHRVSPMRPGRPPGWRRKPNHDVCEVLNELHGLAVWASERRDSS